MLLLIDHFSYEASKTISLYRTQKSVELILEMRSSFGFSHYILSILSLVEVATGWMSNSLNTAIVISFAYTACSHERTRLVLLDESGALSVRATPLLQVFGEYQTAQDVFRRFHQFEMSSNDRAQYSLACQLDGTCPVNVRDQITNGHT